MVPGIGFDHRRQGVEQRNDRLRAVRPRRPCDRSGQPLRPAPANGSLKRSLRTVGAITDNHDLQQTADGNFMLLSYHERAEPVDASEFNGDSSATVPVP